MYIEYREATNNDAYGFEYVAAIPGKIHIGICYLMIF